MSNNTAAAAPATTNVVTLYRHCNLGLKLQDSLNELKDQDKISQDVIEKVMKVFDKSMCTTLATKLNNKASLKAEQCITFNFNNAVYVWTLKDVSLKLGTHRCDQLDYVKIVACDGSSTTTKKTSRKRKK